MNFNVFGGVSSPKGDNCGPASCSHRCPSDCSFPRDPSEFLHIGTFRFRGGAFANSGAQCLSWVESHPIMGCEIEPSTDYFDSMLFTIHIHIFFGFPAGRSFFWRRASKALAESEPAPDPQRIPRSRLLSSGIPSQPPTPEVQLRTGEDAIALLTRHNPPLKFVYLDRAPRSGVGPETTFFWRCEIFEVFLTSFQKTPQ